jgi:hypothetical protein
VIRTNRHIWNEQALKREDPSRWFRFVLPHLIKKYILVVYCCFVGLLPGLSSAQVGPDKQDRVVVNESAAKQPRKLIDDASMASFVALVSRIGWDFVYVVVPATRLPASLSAASAFIMAVYYDSERPYPVTCQPPEHDKWQHCYVGCQIATWCPVGSLSASMLSIMKEVRDAMGNGSFSWRDISATFRGIWGCAGCESCASCCCQYFGS